VDQLRVAFRGGRDLEAGHHLPLEGVDRERVLLGRPVQTDAEVQSRVRKVSHASLLPGGGGSPRRLRPYMRVVPETSRAGDI